MTIADDKEWCCGSPKTQIAGNTDTGFLKIIALIFMLVDHLGVIFFNGIAEFRILGRIALPLYAWCIVVGSIYTRNSIRYCLRLLGLAVVCQPIYMMALNHTWLDLNILFLLFLGAAMLWGIRENKCGSRIWAPFLCFFLLGFLKIDYGWRGLLFILILYLARKSKAGLAAAFLSYALFWGVRYGTIEMMFGIPLTFLKLPGIGEVLSGFFRMQGMMWLALPFILCKTSTGVKLPKTLGYAMYPAHLLLLIIIRYIVNPDIAALIQCFK